MAALFHQFIGHNHQRRMLPFQVGWQQPDDAPVLYRPVKLLPAAEKAFAVQGKFAYVVPAVDTSGGATAFKYSFGFKSGGMHRMRFKKPNWQERYILQSLWFRPNYAYRFCVLLVYGVVAVLEAEDFKRQVFKASLFHRKNFIFMFTNHY